MNGRARIVSRLVPVAAVLAAAGLLYAITMVYAIGETLLALLLLMTLALAVWIYASPRTGALRYLFPGLAAALLFVVLPMVYTMALGFTNYSSSHLLDFARARAVLLAQNDSATRPTHGFTVCHEGATYRLRLEDLDRPDRVQFSPPLALDVAGTLGPTGTATATAEPAPPRLLAIDADAAGAAAPCAPLKLRELVAVRRALAPLRLRLPDGTQLGLLSLRDFGPLHPRFRSEADGSLSDLERHRRFAPDFDTGFFTSADGERLQPGFTAQVGLAHYRRIITDPGFSQPFARIFAWTVLFAGLTVIFAAGLGLLLAVLLDWESLRFRGMFRFLLFLPYAVPGFISILIFKGLFNQNLGEVNLILGHLFGIQPPWFADPLLAKVMLLAVNTWLGFPYMMVICSGLIKSIPADLYEAAALAGVGPLTTLTRITLPLIARPLTPLLIASFAFNFNNFVLITLLTGGRPDALDSGVPAGTTDLLVSYAFRIAFQDSGQQFGLAAAISTVIFVIVAAITLVQVRLTRIHHAPAR